MIQATFEILTGRTEGHLSLHPDFNILAHKDAHEALSQLYFAAKDEGFDPLIVSCFRSFQKQLEIWNKKASGERAVLDDYGDVIDIHTLNEEDLALAIMRWSALPGASRHHWGTDFDIVDKSAFPTPDYQVQLVPNEVESGGIFAPFYDWMENYCHTNRNETFFWPYKTDRGGIAPERWHLSYAPIAKEYVKAYTFEIFWKNISDSDLLLKQAVKLSAHELYHRFFINIQNGL